MAIFSGLYTHSRNIVGNLDFSPLDSTFTVIPFLHLEHWNFEIHWPYKKMEHVGLVNWKCMPIVILFPEFTAVQCTTSLIRNCFIITTTKMFSSELWLYEIECVKQTQAKVTIAQATKGRQNTHLNYSNKSFSDR